MIEWREAQRPWGRPEMARVRALPGLLAPRGPGPRAAPFKFLGTEDGRACQEAGPSDALPPHHASDLILCLLLYLETTSSSEKSCPCCAFSRDQMQRCPTSQETSVG